MTNRDESVGGRGTAGQRTGIVLVFLAGAIILASSIAFTYWMGRIALESNRRVGFQRSILQELDDFISTLKDAETGQRGYLLTGQESYLEPYRKALAEVHTRLDGLHRLTLTGDLAKEPVDRLTGLTQAKLDELDRTIRLRRDRGPEAALAVVKSNEGKRIMDSIRSQVAKLEGQEEAEYQEAARQATKAIAARTIVFVLTALLNLGFLAWAYRRINGEIARRETAVVATDRQREWLATTLTSIGDAVIATDAQGRITLLNPEAERLTGWRSDEAAGRPLADVFHIINEQTRQPADSPVDKVLRLGTVVGLANHTILIAQDGREIPIDDSGAPIRDARGTIQGVVLVFRDFSGQKRADETRTQLAAIVESSDDAILSKGLDGTILSWNAGAERIFGYRGEEIIGQPIFRLLPSDRVPEEQGILERLRRGERVDHFETVRVAKDGRLIDVSVTSSPVKDAEGRVIGASKIIRDITERKRAEEALRRSRDELEQRVEERTRELRHASRYARSLLEASLDPLVTISPEGKITDVNRATEQVTGLPREVLIGSDFSDYFTDPEKAREGYRKVLAEGMVRDYPLTIRGLAGPAIDVLYNATVYRGEAGTVQGVFAAARDITERKRAEMAQARLTAELAEKNREMEQIVYVTSHDLRSPLVNVQGFSKELGESMNELTALLHGQAFPEDQRKKIAFLLERDVPESLRYIRTSITKMDSLLAGLLKLSRLGRVELKEERLDMNRLLGEIARGVEFQVKAGNVTLEITPVPPCRGDALQINQLFSNLLDNALKYLDPGRPGRIRISGQMANGRSVYCLEDNGIGIAPEHQEKIFEIFHRLNPAHGNGEGLGLTIVRRILDRHHGTIRVESEPGRGSKFCVELPKG